MEELNKKRNNKRILNNKNNPLVDRKTKDNKVKRGIIY